MPRSALLFGSVVAASLMAPPGVMDGIGIAPAEAATRVARKLARAPRAAAKVESDLATLVAVPDTTTPATTRVVQRKRRVRFVERKGMAKARYASLPKFKPKVVLKQAAVAPAVEAKTAAIVPPAPSAEKALPPDRVIATASIMPAPVIHPGAERMRSALEARAQIMAAALGAIAVPLPDAAPPAQLLARRVTFDLERGERTIVFDDGAAVTAPFDTGRASDLTGLKPAAR